MIPLLQMHTLAFHFLYTALLFWETFGEKDQQRARGLHMLFGDQHKVLNTKQNMYNSLDMPLLPQYKAVSVYHRKVQDK